MKMKMKYKIETKVYVGLKHNVKSNESKKEKRHTK